MELNLVPVEAPASTLTGTTSEAEDSEVSAIMQHISNHVNAVDYHPYISDPISESTENESRGPTEIVLSANVTTNNAASADEKGHQKKQIPENGTSLSQQLPSSHESSQQQMVGHQSNYYSDVSKRMNCPLSLPTLTNPVGDFGEGANKQDLPDFTSPENIFNFLLSTRRMVQTSPILLQVSGLAKCGKTTALMKSLGLPTPEPVDPAANSTFRLLYLYHELVLGGNKGLKEGVKNLLAIPYESFMYGIKAGMPHEYEFPEDILQKIDVSTDSRLKDPLFKKFLLKIVARLHKPIINAVTPRIVASGKTAGLRSFTNNEILDRPEARRINKAAKSFEDNLRNGVGFCNIWDIDVTETAIRSFIECFGLSFTQKYILLFIDLERDGDKLEYPPEGIPNDLMAEQWRPRLQYLFRNCQMTQRNPSSSPLASSSKKICRIFAKYTDEIENLDQSIKRLRRECKNAARQMGVDDIVNIDIIEVKFEDKAGNRAQEPTNDAIKKIRRILKSIWKEQTIKSEIPIAWFFLIGLLMSRVDFYISKDKLEEIALKYGIVTRPVKPDSSADEHSLDAFCKFFTSFGTIIDVSYIDRNAKKKYVITKPLEFFRCYKKLIGKIDSSGVIALPATANEKVVLDIMVSAGLACHTDDQAGEYYLPSFRANMKPNAKCNSKAIQLSLSISSPRVNLQIEVLKQLLNLKDKNSSPVIKVLYNKSKYSNEVVIKKGVLEVSLTSQGNVLEIWVLNNDHDHCDMQDASQSLSAMQEFSDDLAKIVHQIIKRKSKDFGIPIKYHYAILCKRDDQISTAFNAYRVQHVLPTSLYCTTCKKNTQYDETLEVWNSTLTKNPIPAEHKDGELHPRTIVEIAMKIAERDHWGSAKFLAKTLEGKISLVPPEPSERQWHIMQMLIEWVHKSSILQDESLSKLLARKLIQCHENKDKMKNEESDTGHPPNFNDLARQVDMQVLTRAQRKQIVKIYGHGSDESDGQTSDSAAQDRVLQDSSQEDKPPHTSKPLARAFI